MDQEPAGMTTAQAVLREVGRRLCVWVSGGGGCGMNGGVRHA